VEYRSNPIGYRVDWMHQQLAWYVGGPVLGLCVVALRWLLNERLGATGAWSDVVERASEAVTSAPFRRSATSRSWREAVARSVAFDTRGWLLLGLIAGGVVFGIFGAGFDGYGWLTDTFTGSERWLIVPVLLGAGVLIGFGAKTAGGCTSGNGLGGCSAGSTSSFAATATFMGTAIAVTFLIRAVT
jgi:uncharacterized membrane protein YedE/YeeE